MVTGARAIITLLNRRGFQAFFLGGKCRNELHNIYSNEEILLENVDIITNANADEIKKIFPRNQDSNEFVKYVNVRFAENYYKVFSFKQDKFDYDSVKHTSKLGKKIKYKPAGELDKVRKTLDFTINTVTQDSNARYIDFTYLYGGETISAMKDICNKVLRAVGAPDKCFKHDPLRILRMFRFQSQFGFTIHKDTMKAAIEKINLLKKLPVERMKDEFNKLIAGKYVERALINMRKFGFFDIVIENLPFMECINDIEIEDIRNVETYNRNKTKLNFVELYSILFMHMDIDRVLKCLKHFYLINEKEMTYLQWIIKHQDLMDKSIRNNLPIKLFEAQDDFIKENGRITMLFLIKHITNIVSALEGKFEGKKIYDAFCKKPYFQEQLRPTVEDLRSYVNIDISDEDIEKIQYCILKRLILLEDKDWPYKYDDYMEYVVKGMLDVLPKNTKITIPEEVIKIDGYGNVMDNHKAIQIIELDENSVDSKNL